MSLDNTSKIGDIITALQGLTGINQKVALKSALTNKGITVADTDSMTDMVNKVNNITINSLGGKRCASGTLANVGTLGLNFSGIPVEVRTITGLTFPVSKLYIICDYMQYWTPSGGTKNTCGGVCFTSNCTISRVVNDYGCYLNITASGIGTSTINITFSRSSTSDCNGGAVAGITWIATE